MNLACPLCNSSNYIFYYKNLSQQASIVTCSACSHIYSLITTDLNANELYDDEVYKVVENRNSVFDKLLNREYNGVLKRIASFKPEKGSLLDFGCGKGKFGWLAQRAAWQVKCVETSKNRAAYARDIYKLNVNTEFFNSGKIFENTFSVITLFHVLEHLPHPQQLLHELLKGNLKKRGMLVIEVPNINSLQATIAGKRWLHLDVPRHINHFSYTKLKSLCESIGLKPVKTTFHSFHLGVLGMLDSILKLFGYRKNIILELKNKKSAKLVTQILFVLPFAIILESISALVRKGGIIRMYLVYN